MNSNLDPNVYRVAASLLREDYYFCCDCIHRAANGTLSYTVTEKSDQYIWFFKDLFKPEDVYGLGWWDDGELEPRMTALMMCADILESEQKGKHK